MSKESIKERLTGIIAEQLEIDENDISYDPKQRFVEELGADSLDTVELIMALEDKFGLDIPDEEAAKLTTPKLALDYLLKHAKP